jgi:hypothetical protein
MKRPRQSVDRDGHKEYAEYVQCKRPGRNSPAGVTA